MARKILLADDSVTAQNMGRKILADAGYDVSTVNNGSAALKRINETPPDMVVLDVYMPGHSGLEICQHLKESSDTAHIPVLLTVGKLEPFKPDEARRVRADAYIVKPFEASELLSAVAHLEDVAAASDRLKVTTKAAGKSSAKATVSSEPESSWRSRLGVSAPAPPKKTTPPEPAFHDFRRTRGSQAKPAAVHSQPQEDAPVIPELPRDITPDELDVLSAVAARLDLAGPSQAEAPATEAPVAVAQTTADDKTPEPPTSIQELTQVTAARFLQDPAPVDSTDEPLFSAAAPAQQEEAAPRPTEEMAAPDAAVANQPAAAAENQSVAAAASIGAGAAAFEIATPPQPAETEVEPQKLGEVKSEAPAETIEPFSVAPVVAATSIEAAAGAPELAESSNIGTQETPEQEEPESAAPSEEEIVEALKLLTPAGGSPEPAQESGQETGKIGAPAVPTVSSPRWIAEPMALTPEEASQSLEAEMFGLALVDAVREDAFAPAGDEAPGGKPAMESPVEELTTHAVEEASGAVQEPVSEFTDIAAEPATHPVEENASPVASAEESIPEQAPPATYADLAPVEQDEAAMVAATAESTIAEQAIELALAAQATAGQGANGCEAPKAMAAAATTDGSSATVPDPAAIASIVESVLADLRPKIVEEITRKLMRR